METIYLAGGCLWGVQAFVRTLPGVVHTEAGRINGRTQTLNSSYDGYAECVKTEFDETLVSVTQLVSYLFEIIDPYSLNQQGEDIGEKYRTGVYSENPKHLLEAKTYLRNRVDAEKVVVEVLPLTNYIRSAEEHQDRLERCPNDYCHISKDLLKKYTNKYYIDEMR
ncbi:MAG: peptide-methionine (S)-S-oxide reductase [Clostridia bacterium]|nr:peptide-methionine (S)-S-oxide reductase [Clostridia bacterium]